MPKFLCCCQTQLSDERLVYMSLQFTASAFSPYGTNLEDRDDANICNSFLNVLQTDTWSLYTANSLFGLIIAKMPFVTHKAGQSAMDFQ